MWHVQIITFLWIYWWHQNSTRKSYVKLFVIVIKCYNVHLDQLNSTNNSPVLVFKSVCYRHWNCFLVSVAADGKNEHGLNWTEEKKKRPIFSNCNAVPAKIMKKIMLMKFVWYLPRYSKGAFYLRLKALSNDQHRIDLKQQFSLWYSPFKAKNN